MGIEGTLFIVAAPSGAGKSTLVNALLEREPGISLSISHTTRPPRTGEEYGRHYYFVERAEFEREVAEGIFLEHAEVHGNFYGTSRKTVEGLLNQSRDVLLEIDWQGAQQVKKQLHNAIGIFILPPSLEALEDRLKKRGQDEPNVIVRRLLAAGSEMAHAAEAEYVVINENFDRALADLQCLVGATRSRFASQYARHTQLFMQLGIHLPHGG